MSHTTQEQPDINQRYCNGSDICTAKCYCTDGEGMRDRDTDPFLFSNIVDQGREKYTMSSSALCSGIHI